MMMRMILIRRRLFSIYLYSSDQSDFFYFPIVVSCYCLNYLEYLPFHFIFIIYNGYYDFVQVCIVELGGTIGDIEGMPFVEAFRQFQFRVKKENFCVAHVSLVPRVSITTNHNSWIPHTVLKTRIFFHFSIKRLYGAGGDKECRAMQTFRKVR